MGGLTTDKARFHAPGRGLCRRTEKREHRYPAILPNELDRGTGFACQLKPGAPSEPPLRRLTLRPNRHQVEYSSKLRNEPNRSVGGNPRPFSPNELQCCPQC